MAKLVSKTYGEALFELAVEEGKEDSFLEEIMELKKILKENPDLSRLLNHPKISKENKLEVLKNVFQGRITEELLGFLSLIINKDRYGEINGILDYFIDEVKKLKGIGVAYVTTAIALNEGKQKEVEAKLLATTGYRKMEMHFRVEEKIIGGMIIRIGDRVVDSSIQTKLYEMQRQLLKTQI